MSHASCEPSMDYRGSPHHLPHLFKVTDEGRRPHHQLQTTSLRPGRSVLNHPPPTNSYIPMDGSPENRSQDWVHCHEVGGRRREGGDEEGHEGISSGYLKERQRRDYWRHQRAGDKETHLPRQVAMGLLSPGLWLTSPPAEGTPYGGRRRAGNQEHHSLVHKPQVLPGRRHQQCGRV